MGPHRRRALRDGDIEDAARARLDIVHGEPLLDLAHDTDGIGEGGGGAARAIQQERLVEVDVRLHETGRDESTADVDGLVRGHRRRHRSHDAALRDAEVHGGAAIGQTTAAQEQIEHHGGI